MKTIALIAIQDCMYSSITGPYDVLSVASAEFSREPGASGELFKPVIVGPQDRRITSFNGFDIPVEQYFHSDIVYDIVLVPVILGDVQRAVQDTETVAWLSAQARGGACLCSVCAGAFLLAATGLLAGRKATTHWHLADAFNRQYPEVRLQREKMLVDEGACITAGGVSAHQDLALYLVARFGSQELAVRVSRLMLIDPARQVQTPYQASRFNKSHGDVAIGVLQDWLETHYAAPLTVALLAKRAGLGERTFMRRFRRATGETPGEYLQLLRIGMAQQLLTTSALSVEQVTEAVGYADVSSFRKLFKRYTGLSPSIYRKRFSLCR